MKNYNKFFNLFAPEKVLFICERIDLNTKGKNLL